MVFEKRTHHIKSLFIFILIIYFLIIPAQAAWWDSSWAYRVNNYIANGARPYQLSLNFSNSVGTNNATHIYCNGGCKSDFSDVRFTLDNTTELSYWYDSSVPGRFWVNVTANGTVNVYYGYNSASSSSNGATTFTQYHGSATSTYLDPATVTPTNVVYEAKINRGSAGSDSIDWGVTDSWSWPLTNSAIIKACSQGTCAFVNGAPHNEFYRTIASSISGYSTTPVMSTGEHTLKMVINTTHVEYFVDGVSTGTETKPTASVGLGMKIWGSDTGSQTYSFVRHYSSPEPLWGTWSAQATRIISSWNNNYTNNNSLAISIPKATTINFNVSATGDYAADSYAWFTNGVSQGVTANNSTVTVEVAMDNNISVVATNTTLGMTQMITWVVTLPFTLSSPTNNSVIYFSYPPLTSSVNHTWETVGYPYYNIQISTDTNFAHLVIDDYTSNTYYARSMENNTYYWRVRNYNSITGLCGLWSPTFKYILSSNISTTGTGIHGVVYELIGGVQTPISGATVYLYNSSLSMTTITGTNGYYAFTGLANSTTYSIYSSKQGYETTAVYPVTTGIETMFTKDILMKIYISPYVPNFVFEKFIVRGLFDNPFPGVTVNIYKGSDITPSYTGLTDSMGQVVFQLIKDQYYRVTFSGGGLSSTIERYFYAKEESYLITVVTGFPTGGNRSETITVDLTSTVYNSTHNSLALVYSDSKNTTTLINFYATNISTGETCYRNSTSQSVTLSCTVLASGTYRFGFNATSTVYGFFSDDRVINYAMGNTASPIIPAKTTATLLHWGSVMLIILTTCLFSIRTVKIGVVIVPGLALVVWAVGWLQAPILLLSVAMALGVLVYIRASEVKVNY